MKFINLKNIYQYTVLISLLNERQFVVSRYHTKSSVEKKIFYWKEAGLYGLKIVDDHSYNYEIEYPLLKQLVMMITTRITYGKDVALYKWINGLPIRDEVRETAILESVANTAKRLSVPFRPNLELFFKNLMEATKLVEYALVSDWYYGNGTKPPVKPVNLNDIRYKLNVMQDDIVQLFSNVSDLLIARDCSELVNRAINETGIVNRLTTEGVQRAFGCVCFRYPYHWHP